MKVSGLIQKLNAVGPFDVLLTDNFFCEMDGYGEKGMKATVKRVSKDGLVIAYEKFRDYNIPLESPDYKGSMTATQAGKAVNEETIYLCIGNEECHEIDILEPLTEENEDLYGEFLASGRGEYLRFLEDLVKELRAKANKV